MGINSTDAAGLQTVKQNNDYQPVKQIRDQHIDTKESKNVDQTNVPTEHPITEKSVIDAIEKANKMIIGTRTELMFSIHEKTKQIMVKVVDVDTKEVIREIPNENILDLVAKIWEMAGIMVDESL